MVNLKNLEHFFEHDTFLESFLTNANTDCILYSKDGIKFNIHKEILFQSKLMQNIIKSGECCQNIEIFCPCSEKELETILNFLYNGPISFNDKTDVDQILSNLTSLFGFPENLFSCLDRSLLENSDTIEDKEFEETESYSDNITTNTIENNKVIDNPNQYFQYKEEIDNKNENFDNIFDEANEDKELMDNVNGFSETNEDKEFVKEDYLANISYEAIEDEEMIDNTGNTASDILNPNIVESNNNIEDSLAPEDINGCNVKNPKMMRSKKRHIKDKKHFVPFECIICKEKFRFGNALKIHALNVHKINRPFKCKTCNKQFSETMALNDHIAVIHEGKKLFICQICNEDFKTKLQFQYHMAETHKGGKPYKCNICETKFLFKKYLEKHILITHKGIKPFQCESCGKEFNYKSSMNDHNSLLHSYECDSCDKKFVNGMQLTKHSLSVHEGKEIFQCNNCDKVVSKASQLWKHKSIVHAFECKDCDKKYTREIQLKRHSVSAHEGNKLLKCKHCDKSFATRQDLFNHNSNDHEDKNPFQCIHCKQRFPAEQTMLVHTYYCQNHSKNWNWHKSVVN